MKKISTGAAKPSKKISQQKLTVGLDLGDGVVSGVRLFALHPERLVIVCAPRLQSPERYSPSPQDPWGSKPGRRTPPQVAPAHAWRSLAWVGFIQQSDGVDGAQSEAVFQQPDPETKSG
jgi:hypothetical protein